jgi:hypothetical protein
MFARARGRATTLSIEAGPHFRRLAEMRPGFPDYGEGF